MRSRIEPIKKVARSVRAHREVPPTAHVRHLDKAFSHFRIPRDQADRVPLEFAMKNAAGFSGIYVTVLLGRG